MDPYLIRLRLELVTHAGKLHGQDLLDFWSIIEELEQQRLVAQPVVIDPPPA